ncbi:hypothetical protein [Serratia fonticola]
MERVLTTEKILATECRSTRITTDEKIRFAREIELAVLRAQNTLEEELISSGAQSVARLLRGMADEIEKAKSISSISYNLDGTGFSCEYFSVRGKVSVGVKTEPLV